jgi:hypothetical protein
MLLHERRRQKLEKSGKQRQGSQGWWQEAKSVARFAAAPPQSECYRHRRLMSSLAKYPLEEIIHLLQIFPQVKDGVDLGRG